MWPSRGLRFNGRVPCCVLALPHWFSGREGRHFSHYCSPPAWHVKDGQNQYTYSNKESGSAKSMPLIWSNTFSTSWSRMCTSAFPMWTGRLDPDCMWNKCPLGHPRRRSSPCQYCSCQPALGARRAEWRERAKATVTRELASNSLTVTSTTPSDTAMSHA